MKTGFGWIEIGGKRYEHDVIIHPDGRIEKRRKKVSRPFRHEYGHTPLSEEECTVFRSDHPEVIYIGTGQNGALPLTPGARQLLGEFTAVIAPTPEVVARIAGEKRPYAAILHVTC